MPDWALTLLYVFTLTGIMLIFVYFTANIWGLIGGLIVGHAIASQLVSRLPGFWDKR